MIATWTGCDLCYTPRRSSAASRGTYLESGAAYRIESVRPGSTCKSRLRSLVRILTRHVRSVQQSHSLHRYAGCGSAPIRLDSLLLIYFALLFPIYPSCHRLTSFGSKAHTMGDSHSVIEEATTTDQLQTCASIIRAAFHDSPFHRVVFPERLRDHAISEDQRIAKLATGLQKELDSGRFIHLMAIDHKGLPAGCASFMFSQAEKKGQPSA